MSYDTWKTTEPDPHQWDGQQADGFVDPVESDLHDLISTLASLESQTADWRSFESLMRLANQLKPIEASLLAFRVRLMNRAEAQTKGAA